MKWFIETLIRIHLNRVDSSIFKMLSICVLLYPIMPKISLWISKCYLLWISYGLHCINFVATILFYNQQQSFLSSHRLLWSCNLVPKSVVFFIHSWICCVWITVKNTHRSQGQTCWLVFNKTARMSGRVTLKKKKQDAKSLVCPFCKVSVWQAQDVEHSTPGGGRHGKK